MINRRLGLPCRISRHPRQRGSAALALLDARLLTGIVLVLLSVALGARVVAAADRRVEVWAAARDLGAGTSLEQGDLTVRKVRLDASAARYLAAAAPPTGLVLLRPVGRGELLPAAAVGRPGAGSQRQVVVDVDRSAATGLRKGHVVDVYAVRDPAAGEPPGRPEQVLAGVTVAADTDADSVAFGGGAQVGVPLVVDGPDVAEVIDALSHGQLYVVRVPEGRPDGHGPVDSP